MTAKPPNLPAEQGRAVPATILAPKSGQPATRQPRKAWGGKYNAPAPPEPKEREA
jgi:hypothetical protein